MSGRGLAEREGSRDGTECVGKLSFQVSGLRELPGETHIGWRPESTFLTGLCL